MWFVLTRVGSTRRLLIRLVALCVGTLLLGVSSSALIWRYHQRARQPLRGLIAANAALLARYQQRAAAALWWGTAFKQRLARVCAQRPGIFSYENRVSFSATVATAVKTLSVVLSEAHGTVTNLTMLRTSAGLYVIATLAPLPFCCVHEEQCHEEL